MTISKEFTDDLTVLLNRHGQDTACNTPDYILAGHIGLVLMGIQAIMVDRDEWFGFKPFKREGEGETGEDIVDTD